MQRLRRMPLKCRQDSLSQINVLYAPRTKRQFTLQANFLTFALGGPKNYTGKSMTAAHQRLVNQMGMKMVHFDIVLEHLAASLQDLKVPEVRFQPVRLIMAPAPFLTEIRLNMNLSTAGNRLESVA